MGERRHRRPSFTAFARFLPVQLITKGVPTHESLARAIRPRDPPGGALVAAAALPDDLRRSSGGMDRASNQAH